MAEDVMEGVATDAPGQAAAAAKARRVIAPAVPAALARPDGNLIRLVPRGARLVAEIGCGAGLQGAVHKGLNPGSRYVGFETRPELAEIARRSLDRVEPAGAEQAEVPEGADCLVYNHVLEQMGDPVAALRRQTARLGPDGVVVAAIANAQSAEAIIALLGDRMSGPLPPRAYTRRSILALFAAAGLTIHDLHEEPLEAEAARRGELLHPLLSDGGLDPAEAGRPLGIRRFLLRASRRPREPLLLHNVTLVPGPGQSQVIEIRVRQPMEFLASYPGIEVVRESFREIAPRQRPEGMGKICILQRIILNRDWGAKLVRELRRAGYLLVAEWDDDPDHWPSIAENGHLALKGVHALQVSTPALAEKVAAFNPEVAVFANQIASLPPPRAARAEGPVTFFFGAMNRERDWAPYMSTLNQVLRGRTDVAVQVVHDQRFFDALETEARTFTPNCPTEEYYRLLGQSDISFMPLADTPFNRLKSDLKFIEAASRGAVALASPVVYQDTIVDGRTGLIFRDAGELREKLTALIEQAELRRSIAAGAASYVREHRMLSQHAPLRLKWYRTLLQHRDWLDQALRQRCPEVFAD
ncbi:MAG: glycosyltransferase [Alphaproteobacteria bacterium]|nr:glycosyltransferase [Alphaproteobacteria bacterium]